MKFKFEKLIPNEHAKALIEVYESAGYSVQCPSYTNEDVEWNNSNAYIILCAKKASDIFLCIPKEWFKKKEPLEVGVWYNRYEFNGNPKGYGLIEEDEDGDFTAWVEEDAKSLMPYTKRFMYFKLP